MLEIHKGWSAVNRVQNGIGKLYAKGKGINQIGLFRHGRRGEMAKAYKISTGDDPDQTASVETVYKKLDPVCYCEDCTLPINPVRLKNGEMWKTSDIVTYSKRRFGRQLCHDCQRKAEKAEKNA